MINQNDDVISTVGQTESFWTTKLFLGREFLLWLWHYIEENNGDLELKINGKTAKSKLWIEDKIVLESQKGHVHKQLLRGSSPAKSSEAGVALQNGKFPTELRLVIDIPSLGTFSAMLNSVKTGFSAIDLPENEEGKENPENKLHMRVQQLAYFESAYETLVKIFLSERTSDSWKNKVSTQISTWIKTRVSSSSSEAILH